MGFTLDKTIGLGSDTIKVTADANTSKEVRQGKILVQVKGITKKIISLIQKGEEVEGT